jgi:hypothetical protein
MLRNGRTTRDDDHAFFTKRIGVANACREKRRLSARAHGTCR